MSVDTRILAGRRILRNCAKILNWQQAYNASEITVCLFPRVNLRSLRNSDRQYVLSQKHLVGFPSDAAAAALQAGKAPLIALALLEQGRGILGMSVEEMRTDIADLKNTYPEPAEQFIRFRDELRPRDRLNLGDKASSIHHNEANRRCEAGKKLDEVMIKIRQHSEFKDFLLAPSNEEMQHAAVHGCIVVINVSEYRCDAILIEQ